MQFITFDWCQHLQIVWYPCSWHHISWFMIREIKWIVPLYCPLKELQVCHFFELDESVFTLYYGHSIHKKLYVTDVLCPANPDSLLWRSSICAQLFFMSQNCIVTLTSWQSSNFPVFVLPNVSLPSFWSQIRTQFVVFWRVCLQVFLRRQFWQSISFDWEFIMRWDLAGCKYAEQRFNVPIFRAWSVV